MSLAVSSNPKDNDVEVRLLDQEQITEFGRLNNRLLELRAEKKQAKTDMDKLDDANTELELVIGGKVMLFIGESFVETDEDYAKEYCEKKIKELGASIDKLKIEEEQIVNRQDSLKKILYARFGDAINLEN